MSKLLKVFRYLKKLVIKQIRFFSSDKYMMAYTKELTKQGIKFTGKPHYIAPNVYFDGSDYSLIEIDNKVTLSGGVKLLTHDQSLLVPYRALGESFYGFKYDSIHIGENSFIGLNAIILQGTHIGKNTIVGAGSVVKGVYPDNVIIVGNPAKIVVDDIFEWHERKKNNIEELAKIKIFKS